MYFMHPDNHLELLTGRSDEPDCVDESDRGDAVGPRSGCGCGGPLPAVVRRAEAQDIAW
jgi:hypothetical protein